MRGIGERCSGLQRCKCAKNALLGAAPEHGATQTFPKLLEKVAAPFRAFNMEPKAGDTLFGR